MKETETILSLTYEFSRRFISYVRLICGSMSVCISWMLIQSTQRSTPNYYPIGVEKDNLQPKIHILLAVVDANVKSITKIDYAVSCL